MGRLIADNYEQRVEICRSCPFYKEERGKCGKCGCNVTLKCRFKHSKCPDKRWNNGVID